MITQIQIHIREASAVAEARREVVDLAQAAGFDATAIGKIALVVTEAATNLVKYVPEGRLLARAFERDGVAIIEVLVLDQGPGMANIGEAMRDGYSTAGGAGTGLGAIKRLSDEFDIYSVPGKGVALVARLWSRRPPGGLPLAPIDIAAICLPKPGEEEGGDTWAVEWQAGHCVILVADGLGHGPDAAAAAAAAVNAFRSRPQLGPAALIEFAWGALRGTRGAALAVADLGREEARYAGVGNIAGVIWAPEGARHLVSYSGIVGHEARRIQEFVYPWPPKAMLIMHSDGLMAHWSLDQYPGLTVKDPSLIAGVLYRDFARDRDDVTVVVAKRL